MPLVKLGYLLIRTIAKPVSGAIKNYAKDHPKFKEMCMSVAQRYHKSEVRLRRGLIVQKKRTTNNEAALVQMEPEIKPLDPAKAIETGANFIGESIVFVVAGVLLVADQLSSRAKEQARRDAVEARFKELEEELEKAKNQITNITNITNFQEMLKNLQETTRPGRTAVNQTGHHPAKAQMA